MQKSNKLKRKKYVIINIRGFNKIAIIDLYFMLLQTNVILTVVEDIYISIFDVADFFCQ